MSVYVLPPKSDLMTIATRRLFQLLCSHSVIAIWILVAQVHLHVVSPIMCIFLMNLNLLWLAERSWMVQAKTMLIWHPVVQLFFCVSRILHGAAVVLSVVLWAKIALLCAGGGC
jgi:hypothetical protein